VMGRADWRAFAVALVAAGAACGAGVIAAHLAATFHPIPLALVVVGIFGVSYVGMTLLLRHPDAARLWTSLR
jgi:hypothetical protein